MSQLLRGDQAMPAWPIPGRPLAWGVPGSLPVSSIPLRPEDMAKSVRLTKSTYLSVLADRVAWMMEQEDDPLAAQSQLAHALDALGAWSGPSRFGSSQEATDAMMVENPAFSDLLTPSFLLPSIPWRLCQIPEAVEAIQETNLGDWIDAALWMPTDSPEI